MQDLAPIEQQTNTPAPSSSKPRRIPKAIVRAIGLLTSGECTTIKAAAERSGITREWLSRNLQRDHVRVFAARKSRETIATGQMIASARLIELIHAGSEHVSADVSKWVAGVAGIAPAQSPSVSVNIELKAGYVIDLSERNPRAEQIIEHNQQGAFPNVGNDGKT